MMHTGTETESQTKCSGLLGDTKLWFCGGLFQLEFFRCKFDWCVEASSALDVAVNTFISWHTIGGKEMNNQMMQPVVRVHLIRQFCWWTLLRFSFASHTFRLLYFILLLSSSSVLLLKTLGPTLSQQLHFFPLLQICSLSLPLCNHSYTVEYRMLCTG